MHKVKAQHRRAREYPEEEFNPWRRRERPEENPRMNRTPAIGVYDDDGSPLREAKKRDLPRFLRRLFDHFDKEPKPDTTLKRAVPLASFFEDRRFTAMSQLRATFLNSWFNFIGIVLVPAGFAVRYTKGPSLATFLVNFFAIIPVSIQSEFAIAELTIRIGDNWGSFAYVTIR